MPHSTATRSYLSRQAVQILLHMKQLLSQHGISIKLSESNIIVHVLEVVSKLNDPALEDCRKRLLEIIPHHDKVFLFATSNGQWLCINCNKTISVELRQEATIHQPQVVMCQCNMLYYVGQNTRQHVRKTTHLIGQCHRQSGSGNQEKIVIENVSVGGARIRLLSSLSLTPGEILNLEFHLNDKAKTLIAQPGCVLYVFGDSAGIQFMEPSSLPPALATYVQLPELIG